MLGAVNSQSGKSPNIVAVLAEARRQDVLTVAITHFADSDLGRQADYVINLQAGIERTITATKTYTSQLAAIALLCASLAQDEKMLSALQQIPETLTTISSMEAEIAQIVRALPE